MGKTSFWSRFSRSPSTKLAQVRQKLDKLVRKGVSSSAMSNEAWTSYQNALGIAAKCGRDTLTDFVIDVDRLFPPGPAQVDPQARAAIVLLLSAEPASEAALEAALRLAHRRGETAQIRDVEHRLCLVLARRGDSDRLISKLLDRRQRSLLEKRETEAIVQAYLETRNFDAASPWASYFNQLPPEQLPRIHQVLALLGRYPEAAEIAEEQRDFRAALRYLLQSPGLEAAQRALKLNQERVHDPDLAILAHRQTAEALWLQADYLGAAEHFRQAGDRERLSDCYLNAGKIPESIRFRPVVSPDWTAMVRDKIDAVVRRLIQSGDLLEGIRLVHGAIEALSGKGTADSIQAEISRLNGILHSMVRTARTSLAEQARGAQPGAEVFRRWSALEEAAGNFLEAGIQAEFGQDYVTATLMFEKAGAYGRALRAFEQSPEKDQIERKAVLLEHGGDFLMAGFLYQGLGQTEKAIDMFEQAGDFSRAATTLREQLGDERAALDNRYLKLMASAGRSEDVAQLCWQFSSNESAEERGRFLQRIKELIDGGYVAEPWSERVAIETAEMDKLAKTTLAGRAVEWTNRATKEVLNQYADFLGIDLGTTNTVVALYRKDLGQPEVVELDGKALIPSTFIIDNAGSEIAGEPATAWLGKSPQGIVIEAKRMIGSGKTFKVGDRHYRPEEISARIVQCAQQRASQYLQRKIADRIAVLAHSATQTTVSMEWTADLLRQHPPATIFTRAVVTVPAYFNEAQKQATHAAAEIAGLKLLRLVHEPTAACLAQRDANSKGESVLVVDLGAGTLDLSLVQLGDGIYEVREIEGDTNLGSADLDKMLLAHFQSLVTKSFGRELGSMGKTRLLAACEELKIELSFRSSAEINLVSLVDNQPFCAEFSRKEFLELARSWIDRIAGTCRKIKSKPDRLLLVGGGTLMPAVRECIRDVFRLDVNVVGSPLTAVARGAARQAAILAGVERSILLLDATPFSLGIKVQVREGQFEFSKLIPKHTTIPARHSEKYTTVKDNQPSVSIDIYQGESSDPDLNFKIGQFMLDGVPPAKAGVPQIEVAFDINADCLLTVTARDLGTGRQCGTSIQDSHLLTPAQMSAMKERLQKTTEEEEIRRSLLRTKDSIVEARDNAEMAALPQLQSQFQNLIADFELHLSRYAPAASDNTVIMEIYRRRDAVSVEVHLLLDKWSSLQRSTNSWLSEAAQSRTDNNETLKAGKALAAAGENLLQRLKECVRNGAEFAKEYRHWNGVLSRLPISPTGDPEDVITSLLRRSQYEEALKVLERQQLPLKSSLAELGLEIFARKHDRSGYGEFLTRHAQALGLEWPDFARLNQCIRTYAASVALIHCETTGGRFRSGTGFAIGPREIATNLHVLMAESGQLASPKDVSVITKSGRRRVSALNISKATTDDVAILKLAEGEPDFPPLRLGFSEITELGERILTIGFPAPRDASYEENLYCNTGLINRITRSDLCSERVIEVSIELHGGISGAPILNEFGEVIGLLTFSQQRQRMTGAGDKTTEQSHYAIPVEVLRRLWRSS